MSGEVVTDDDVAGLEGGAEHLADIFAEDQGIRGPWDDQASGLAIEPQRAQHGRGVPMAHGSMVMKALAAQSPATQADQVGLGTGFVQKDQLRGRQLALGCFPKLSFFGNISALLFAGPQRFF